MFVQRLLFNRFLILFLFFVIFPGATIKPATAKSSYLGTLLGNLILETEQKGYITLSLESAGQQLQLRTTSNRFDDPKPTFADVDRELKKLGISNKTDMYLYSLHGRSNVLIDSIQYRPAGSRNGVVWDDEVIFLVSFQAKVIASSTFPLSLCKHCQPFKLQKYSQDFPVLLSKKIFFQSEQIEKVGLKKNNPALYSELQKIKPTNKQFEQRKNPDNDSILPLPELKDKVIFYADREKIEYLIAIYQGDTFGDEAYSLVRIMKKIRNRYVPVRQFKDVFSCFPIADITADGVPELLCFYPYAEWGIFDIHSPIPSDIDTPLEPLLGLFPGI